MYVTPAFRQLLGCDLEDGSDFNSSGDFKNGGAPQSLLGKRFSEALGPLLSPASRVAWIHAFNNVLSSRRADRFVLNIRDREFLIQLIPELDGQDQLCSIAGEATDLHDPKSCRTQLEQLQLQLDAIIRAFPDLFFWLEADGTIIRCHAGRETIVPLHQLVNRPVYDVLPPDVAIQYRNAIQHALEHAECSLEFQLLKPKTGLRWLEARFRRLSDSRVLAVVRDITDRKTVEIELQETVAKLQKALDEVSFLRGLVPICANCKKIRRTDGGWISLEVFLADHALANFSHGFCPDCGHQLYGDLWTQATRDINPPQNQ